MTRLDPPSLPRLHEDAERFEEAVRFTASETRFLPRLIEKDYFCTLLLGYLSTADSSLVFKGGTCLAKVHVGFYRLSEDLDFIIPVPYATPQSKRSRMAEGLKKAHFSTVEENRHLPDRQAAYRRKHFDPVYCRRRL